MVVQEFADSNSNSNNNKLTYIKEMHAKDALTMHDII